MVSVTLSLPADVRGRMKRFPEVNWSGFIRRAIEDKTSELAWREDMLKRLSGEDELVGWSVRAQRTSRAGRLAELRKKGLL
jgi:hypothetical protein